MDIQRELPLDYPLGIALAFYFTRFLGFGSVVLLNFSLLGLLVGVPMLTDGPSSAVLIILAVAEFILLALLLLTVALLRYIVLPPKAAVLGCSGVRLGDPARLVPVLSVLLAVVGLGLAIKSLLLLYR